MNEKEKMDEKEKKNQSAEAKSGEVHTGAPADNRSNSGKAEKKPQSEADREVDNRENGETKAPDDEQQSRDGEDQQSDYEEIITNLKDELEVTRDSMLRKAAEFDNLKKRTQRERALLYEDAKVDAVSKFLPIREDLKRSVEISRERKVDPGFLEGLELVINNFDRVLEQYGVEPIEDTGVSFDVDMHDAMLSQPAEDESTDSNVVIQVLEPGYKIGDRVIRHAKVIVSQ